MLNYYMTEFMRSTIAVPEATDENKSSSSEKYYQDCPVCSKTLVNQSLRDHIKVFHVATTFSARDAARELAADASKHGFIRGSVFKCKKCGERFSSREGIKLHIDAYANGDCCPESSQVSDSIEKNAASETVSRNRSLGFAQIIESIEQNAGMKFVEGDCCPVSLQIIEPNDQNAACESTTKDCCQGSSQNTESIEQNDVCESANKDCCPGPSQITESVQQSAEREPALESVVHRSCCENFVAGDSKHYASNLVEETAFICRFCFYACENLDDMVDHYSIHELLRACYQQDVMPTESRPNHQCPDCLKLFDSMDDLIDHINLVYRRPFTCPSCHEFLTSETSYDQHFEIHTSDLVKLYRDSLNQGQNDMTNSTEDQEISKSIPKRRRRRSKKIQDNQRSDKNLSTLLSPNARKAEILQSKLNVNTIASYHQSSTIKASSYEADIESERIPEDHSYNVSPTSQKVIHSHETQEVACTKTSFDREDNENEPREARRDSEKNLEKDISTASQSFQNVYSPKTQEVASTNDSYDQEDIKNEESSLVMVKEDYEEANKESDKSGISKLEIKSEESRLVMVKEDYEEANKKSDKSGISKLGIKSEESRLVMVEEDYEEANKESDKSGISKLEIKSEESRLVMVKGDYEEANKESEKNSEESDVGSQSPQIILSPYTQKVASGNVSSDQEVTMREESKEYEKILQDSASVATSSIPQIIDLPNKRQVVFTYASSDQEEIVKEDCREVRRESENNEKDNKSVSSSLIHHLRNKLATTENYDADFSASASSDDQEIVQIHPCGTYVVRAKKNRQVQYSDYRDNDFYRCTKCNITFESASNFVAHNLMHSNFMCLKCKERYLLKATFLEHLALHTGKNPFACVRCWMSYKTSIDLKIHENFCRRRNRNP